MRHKKKRKSLRAVIDILKTGKAKARNLIHILSMLTLSRTTPFSNLIEVHLFKLKFGSRVIYIHYKLKEFYHLKKAAFYQTKAYLVYRRFKWYSNIQKEDEETVLLIVFTLIVYIISFYFGH